MMQAPLLGQRLRDNDSLFAPFCVFCAFALSQVALNLPMLFQQAGLYLGNLIVLISGVTVLILYRGIVNACTHTLHYNYGRLFEHSFGRELAFFALILMPIRYLFRMFLSLKVSVVLISGILLWLAPSIEGQDDNSKEDDQWKDHRPDIKIVMIILAVLYLPIVFGSKATGIMQLKYISYAVWIPWIYVILLSLFFDLENEERNLASEKKFNFEMHFTSFFTYDILCAIWVLFIASRWS